MNTKRTENEFEHIKRQLDIKHNDVVRDLAVVMSLIPRLKGHQIEYVDCRPRGDHDMLNVFLKGNMECAFHISKDFELSFMYDALDTDDISLNIINHLIETVQSKPEFGHRIALEAVENIKMLREIEHRKLERKYLNMVVGLFKADIKNFVDAYQYYHFDRLYE